MKKLFAACAVLVLAIAAAAFVMSRVVFASDAARQGLAAQLSEALGQPVTVGGIRASALARVTITLTDVTVGDSSPVRVDAVEVRAGLLSFVTRRLENASLTLHGAHVPLPPPALAFVSAAPKASAPVALGSIRQLTLDDLEMTTRGRRLRVNADLALSGERGVSIRRASVVADDMTVTVTGEITDRSVPQGRLTARADRIDGDLLLAIVSELTGPAGQTDVTGDVDATMASASQTDTADGLTVDVEASRVALGTVALTGFKGLATVRRTNAVFEPVSFGLFSGKYEGQVAVRYPGGTPSVRWYGDLSGISLADVMTQAEQAGALTGTLSGDVDLTGTGSDFARAMRSARGSARVQIANGAIGKLAIVRSVLAATSANPQQAAENPSGPADTAFKTLSSALTITTGSASLIDLEMTSDDLLLRGGGGLKLDGSAVTVFADVDLSEALSSQIATDRGRQLAPGARVTVPATIRGNTTRYSVQVDLTEMRAAGSDAR